MGTKLKAGTYTAFPVKIDDNNFASISAIEFLFTQTENGDALKTAYWSRDGESRDAVLIEGTHNISITFSRDDTYKFKQNALFYMDTRIHYEDSEYNPITPIVSLTMNKTLFEEGQEVGP